MTYRVTDKGTAVFFSLRGLVDVEAVLLTAIQMFYKTIQRNFLALENRYGNSFKFKMKLLLGDF